VNDALPDAESARTLVLMRHGRASQEGSDFDRDLEPEGRHAAIEAGRWLAGRGIDADAAIVSAARRAFRTWSALRDGAGWQVDADVDRALYHADPESALDLVRLIDDDVASLVVVGHNPTVASLAQLLDDGEGDLEAGIAMAGGFPPGSLAVFSYDGSWADLGWAAAELLAFRPGS
jgi:phosphohistidine phosphatase